jgi:3-oxoacyl-[acyl-carrier-protein] synthase-3
MNVKIKDIAYHLPEKIVTNDDLHAENPDWDMKNVEVKSGVVQRHIAADTETAFDLAAKAVDKLFASGEHEKNEIDAIIFCTQSPDYIMPSNAFLLHDYLDLKEEVLAFDFNLACSGYIYGLALARSLIISGTAHNVLLATGDTYSKYINNKDRSARVLFGDGATVSLITATEDDEGIFDVMLATSGKHHKKFYIPAGGCRLPSCDETSIEQSDASGNVRSADDIYMDGMAVWSFIQSTVPKQIKALLSRNSLDVKSIDQYVFHQASKLTLDSLVRALKLDPDRVFIDLANTGNLVSSSVPVALKRALLQGKIKSGSTVLISGFGVGLSWGSMLIKF